MVDSSVGGCACSDVYPSPRDWGGTNLRWIYLVHRPRRPVTIAINPLLTPPLLSPLPHAPPPYPPSKLESPNLPLPTHNAPSPPYKPPTPLHSRFAPACGRRPPAPRRTTQTTARDTRAHVPNLRIPSLSMHKTGTHRPPGRFLCADGPSPLRVLFWPHARARVGSCVFFL